MSQEFVLIQTKILGILTLLFGERMISILPLLEMPRRGDVNR